MMMVMVLWVEEMDFAVGIVCLCCRKENKELGMSIVDEYFIYIFESYLRRRIIAQDFHVF